MSPGNRIGAIVFFAAMALVAGGGFLDAILGLRWHAMLGYLVAAGVCAFVAWHFWEDL